jgi:D-beta-D-heptose 7-phosphate kinase/D-beta-D-heptose 1-phosphate adenosyltransferase
MKTIWCNGTFDVLHPGHIELFKVAKSLGDKLVVAIDSDEKIKKDKGADRPINSLESRKAILEAIKYIDIVIVFNTAKELARLIALYTPDIIVLGDDWREKEVIGADIAKEVRFLPRVGEYASSDIISKIKSKA